MNGGLDGLGGLLRASWVLLGPPWELLGPSWELLGSSWAFGELLGASGGPLGSLLGTSREPLGASWGVLGASWEPLGVPWGVLKAPGGALGASWGALGSIFFGDEILIVFWIDFGTEKGAQREAFWKPKWHQNRSKNEFENEANKKTLLGASWVDFGSLWGASWGEKTSNSIGGTIS